MSRRTPRDIAWILSLLAIAIIGIRLLYLRIDRTTSVSEMNIGALITQQPQAVIRVHRPQLLQLMLPSTPQAQRLLTSFLPNNALCQLDEANELPSFTLVYYPEGEVWLAAMPYNQAQSLFRLLNKSHDFAPIEETVWKQIIRYYPEDGKHFLGCVYQQGVFMASYQRKLLLSTMRQGLRPQSVSSEQSQLKTACAMSTDAPLQLILPTQTLLSDSLVEYFFGANKPSEWVSIPFFFNEGNLCGIQEWELPKALTDSLLTEQWLYPLKDTLLLELHRLLPQDTFELQATQDDQFAYFTLYTH